MAQESQKRVPHCHQSSPPMSGGWQNPVPAQFHAKIDLLNKRFFLMLMFIFSKVVVVLQRVARASFSRFKTSKNPELRHRYNFAMNTTDAQSDL